MRRILAIVLPDLPCELVRRRAPSVGSPLAVMVVPSESSLEGPVELRSNDILDAVDEVARRAGIHPRQRVTEATTLSATLAIHRVSEGAIHGALALVADVARRFGVTAAISLADPQEGPPSVEKPPFREQPFDTVWLDVTGAAHLVGGETILAHDVAEGVRALGHRVRVAIASGPRIAQALARFSRDGEPVVIEQGQETEALGPLPVHALPLPAETAVYLVRLGLLRVRDVARLPPAELSARLGAHARGTLDALRGHDPRPLVAFNPPAVLEEHIELEEGVHSTEPLLFVLRGMASRLAARLGAHGEATTRIEVALFYDRSIAKLRFANQSPHAHEGCPEGLSWAVDLPRALAREADLMRVIRAWLDRAELFAPVTSLQLSLPQIVASSQIQLDLSRRAGVDPDRLPALVAELAAELGPERVGLLATIDSHVPEKMSRLVHSLELKRNELPSLSPTWAPSRLLPVPIPVGKLRRGLSEILIAGPGLPFTAKELVFCHRINDIAWWTPSPISRDYFHAWLTTSSPQAQRPFPRLTPFDEPHEAHETGALALLFIDRETGDGYLQGWDE